jgi:multidrug efflux pump subunit AcrA (membrane-fusion protein)
MDDAQADLIAPVPATIQRGIVYLAALILVAALAVLYFGKVYVVVNARGRIVPEGDVVIVQTLQGGVVNAVLAKAGDRLPAGAPIVKLDLSEPGMNLAELRQKGAGQSEEIARVQATVALIDRILASPERALDATRNTVIATVGKTTELVNDLENMKARVDAATGAVVSWPSRKVAMVREVELTRENVRVNEASYNSQARLLQSTEAALVQKKTQLDGFRRLNERQLLSALELGAEEEKYRSAEAGAAEARRRVEQLEIDISNQKIKLAELEARVGFEPALREGALRQAQNTFRQSLALLRQDGENLRNQARELEAGLRTTDMRLKMAENQMSLTSVMMPVAGLVAEMKVSAAGELLTAGQMVATIVPDGVPLVVEAAVPNSDIGFVRVGVEARVKVDAYPFQQFGTLPAQVRTVLPGLGRENNFTVRLDLLQSKIVSKDGELPLFPGLAVEAELLTARQRLINLVLASASRSRSRRAE